MTTNLPIAARHASLDRPAAFAAFFQGLADPTRVRILDLLMEKPMNVSQLVDSLDVAQGRVSSHLACLRWCGYVRAEVDGRFNRYSLVDERVGKIVRLAEAVMRDNVDRLASCLVLEREGAA